MILFILAVIICILWLMFQKLWFIFLFLFLFLILLILLKIYIQYKKYGDSVFRVFKNISNENYDEENLINLIKQTNTNYKIIKKEDSLYKFIVVSNTGIYAFYLSNYKGLLYGSINDDKLSLKTSIKNIINVDNFLKEINNDLRDYKVNIEKIIVTRNDLLISVGGMQNTTIVKIKNLFYYFIKRNKNNDMYSKKEIDELADILS